MSVLVTGAGGTVGASLVARLVAAGETVRAAGRRPDSLSLPAGVGTVHLDLADPAPDLDAALAGVERVFLYADPAGLDDLVPALAARGVTVVLLSSEAVGLPGAEADAIARPHLLVERALDEAGVACTALRPGTFDSLALRWADAIRTTRTIERAYPDVVLSPIHPEDIAEVAEHVLMHGGAREPITLHGPEPLTPRDQVGILADVLGVTLTVAERTPDEVRAALSRDTNEAMADSLLRLWSYAAAHPTASADTSERITGRPSRTFRQWAEANRAAFG